MARKPRIHVPGGIYHRILRGIAGQRIFLRDDCGPSRNHKAAELRSVIGHLAMQTEWEMLTEVAPRSVRDVATLSQGVRPLTEQAEVSGEAGQRIAHLLEQLKAN